VVDSLFLEFNSNFLGELLMFSDTVILRTNVTNCMGVGFWFRRN
jgi:hypothetical protein